MKVMAFLFGIMVMGILLLRKNSEKKDSYDGYFQHQLTDEDVWLGN